MPLQFPDYSYQYLNSYTACALIEQNRIDDSEENQPLVAHYDTQRGRVFVRLIMNNQDDPNGVHVHLDTAREESFYEPPATNSSMQEIRDKIEGLRSDEIYVRGHARFDIPTASLPEQGVIALLRNVRTGPVDANVRLTGSTFRIDDGPVTSLSWKVFDEYEDDESIVADIRSEDQIEWGDNYLIEGLHPLVEAFRAFVLEEPITPEVDHAAD